MELDFLQLLSGLILALRLQVLFLLVLKFMIRTTGGVARSETTTTSMP